ncbi:GlxA family transcriptional regulator [Streptomyces sp. NPDC021224]|uniref:GlxA family transcriptional regulator n=1 Tax=unclassified Streptomyces TaxID=2593676 RepID=UPI0037AC9585
MTGHGEPAGGPPRPPGGRPSHDVLVVLFDGVQSLDVTGPVEVFAAASSTASDPAPYRVRTASLGGGPVRTSAGLRLLPDEDLRTAAPPGTLLVPGGSGTHRPDPEAVARVAALAPDAVRVVSVCTGAFLLAEAGLLEGRRATTHWAYCATLARRFPGTDVDPQPIFVRDGKYATSAGVTAGIDLALALVEEDLGRDAALAVARGLVVFLRRPGSQAQFSTQLAAQVAEREPLREVQRWITEHPEADLSVDALAARAALSPRQFARAFRAEVGVPPGRYVDRARLEAARRLLEDTDGGIAEVARAAGYGTPEAMRRAFLRTLALPPAEYRRRFHSVRS